MIVYASRTGNVRHIVSKLGLPAMEIQPAMQVAEPFILFTYTDGIGSVPQIVEHFMTRNSSLCRGVIVSGNTNFGQHNFARAGDLIAQKYNVPLVRKIDLRGSTLDYTYIQSFYTQFFTEGCIDHEKLFKA